MKRKMRYGYREGSLRFDPRSGRFSLIGTDDAPLERLRVELSPDGEHATVFDVAESVLNQGQVQIDPFALLMSPEGQHIRIERVIVGGKRAAYLPSLPLEVGVVYAYLGASNTRLSPHAQARDFYVSAMRVETDQGLVPSEWLVPGDRVMTRNNGFQTVLWAGITRLTSRELETWPALSPIEIAAVEGHAALVVPPNQRLLLEGGEVTRRYEDRQMLCKVGNLGPHPDLRPVPLAGGVCYHHILLPRHDLVLCEGRWIDSVYPDDLRVSRFPRVHRAVKIARMRQEIEDESLCRSELAAVEARNLTEIPLAQMMGQSAFAHAAQSSMS